MTTAERFPCTQQPATAQEVFDRALSHLRQQGCRSMDDEGICVYWNEDGLHCGIGIFIRPEEYRSWMEGKPIAALLLNDECPTRLYNELIEHIARPRAAVIQSSLLETIQWLHDHVAADHWEESFQKLAKDFNLIYTPKSPT